MRDVVWLASYPKSGNTWLRLLIGGLWLKEGEAFDINASAQSDGIASSRDLFESLTLIDSGLLTHDQIDELRPDIYAEVAQGRDRAEELWDEPGASPVRFVKVHDAYTHTPSGRPLLGGVAGAKGAIVIVRDPRDVAASYANYDSSTIDATINKMNEETTTLGDHPDRQHNQLRQKLLGWSSHIASWLDQGDIPVHLLRYEDLKRDVAGVLKAALDFAGLSIPEDDIARSAALCAFDNLQAQEREKGFSEASRRRAIFFRRGAAGGWRDELTVAQVRRIESAHAPMMARLGYRLADVEGADLTIGGVLQENHA